MSDRKAQGIEATNQAFLRYDQVDKRQEYHLAEANHAEAFDEETRIRDLRPRPVPPRKRGRQAGLRRRAGRRAAPPSASPSSRATASTPRLYDEAEARILELFTGTRSRRSCATAPALRLGQPGLLPDQGDERHPPRPGRGLGVLPPRVRPRRRSGVPRGRTSGRAPAHEPFFRRMCQAHEQPDPAGDAEPAPVPGLRPAPLRPQAHGHQLRPAAQLLPAAARGGRGVGRRPHARPRGRGPLHLPSCRPGRGAADPEPAPT